MERISTATVMERAYQCPTYARQKSSSFLSERQPRAISSGTHPHFASHFSLPTGSADFTNACNAPRTSVCERSGPTPTIEIGTPMRTSIRLT